MATFSAAGQPPLNAIVADIGQYATKIGWAGDDQPKSYFRSNVAVLRDEASIDSKEATATPSSPSKSTPKKSSRSSIVDVRYDYYNRPILGYDKSSSGTSEGPSDGAWEIANPVDSVTGLWHQPPLGGRAAAAASASPGPATSMQDPSAGAANEPQQGADWADLIPRLLRHGYRTGLNVRSNNDDEEASWDYPLLLCERSYNPPPLRQQLLEVLMEELQVNSVFLARDAVMSCYATGRTQGTVVDMGYGGTTVTPVYDGYAEQHSIMRAPIGLGYIDARVLENMDLLYSKQQAGSSSSGGGFMPLYQVKQKRDFGWTTPKQRSAAFHEAARLFVAQECRLTGAGIAVDTTNISTNATNSTSAPLSFQAPNKSFTLPDGTDVHLSSQFRFQSASILVGRPQIVNANNNNANGEGGTAPTPAVIATHTTAEQEVRQQVFQKNKQEWLSYIQQQQQQQQASQQPQDDAKPMSAVGSGNGGAESADIDFSDAAAVGIAKRRTKRQKKDPSGASNTSTPTRAPPPKKSLSFSNARLGAACNKYFSTIVDQSLTSAPIAQMIIEAAYKCDRDQQPSLLGNVILGGGGSCLGPTEQAVPDWIKEQTESLIHAHSPGWRVKMLAPGFAERSVLPWLGGSILASLGSFHEMYVTKADYDEWGSAIVNRKCP